MAKYLFKRILIFIPTLIVISFLAFGLSKMAPGDPVYAILAEGPGISSIGSYAHSERVYEETAVMLGLDKPVFYASLSSQAFPDTIYRILKRTDRNNLKKLIYQYGNWPEIELYFHELKAFQARTYEVKIAEPSNELTMVKTNLKRLFIAYKDNVIQSRLDTIDQNILRDEGLLAQIGPDFKRLKRAYESVLNNSSRWKLYVPDVKWNGWDNQYHHWFFNFIQGDFGLSYKDNRPVASSIWEALKKTLLLNFLALFFVFILAIPLGVFSATYRDSFFDRATTLVLFILYSLPTFWIGTMLVVFFTTPEYNMNWFPSSGLGELPAQAPFWDRFWETAGHLILPVFCLTYGSLAFLSRQVRSSMLQVIQEDYVRTAYAKGLRAKTVIWKHAFRNALFPLITLLASIFPGILAGSVVIEVIFNIFGMGKLTVDAIFDKNWPIVYTVLMLSAIMTMVGILVADILYAWADPRVTYGKRKG